jgi:non-ribosomal peptide synthetase component F/acyl carrier protein
MEFEPDDVFCHNMSLNVGFSQERLFLPLLRGLQLAIIPDEDQADPRRFLGALSGHGVTQVTLTPQKLQQILDLGEMRDVWPSSLRTVAVGGSVLSAELAERFCTFAPGAKLVNAYGSTESGSVIRGLVRHCATRDPILLGRPVAGADVSICDPEMNPCTSGVSGEICVEGPSVAIGYLNDPQLTSERFIQDPVTGRRLYRTGDRGRFAEDGQIEFLGRMDRQVKIRGYRVEFKEVETALLSHPEVAEAHVTAQGRDDDLRLAGYVAPVSGKHLKVARLREHLLRHLPKYMMPASLTFLELLPRTPNGKVDAAGLPVPHVWLTEARPNRREPVGRLETTIAEIWTGLLGFDKVGAHEDFLELGGDSLLTVQMVSQVEKLLDVRVPLRELPRPLTVADLASAVSGLGRTSPDSLLPRIERIVREGTSPLSIVQEERLRFETLAGMFSRPHDQGATALMLSMDGRLDTSVLALALKEMVRRHESLRTAFKSEASVAGLRVTVASLTPDLLRRVQARIHFRAVMHPEADISIDYIDIVDHDNGDVEAAIQRVLQKTIRTCFDWHSAPLMKVVLVRTGPEQHALAISLSHLICDGWSLEVLHRELSILYDAFSRGESSPLPDLAAQYADFAYWQRRALRGAFLHRLVSYWTRQYRKYQFVPIDELPIAHRPTARVSLSAASEQIPLDDELVGRLLRFARASRVTFFVLLLAALNILLHFYTGRQQIGVGTFFANRSSSELESLVGWFAQHHMVGVTVEPNQHVHALLEQVRDRVIEAQVHQDIPQVLLMRYFRKRPVGPGNPALRTSPWVTLEMRSYREVPSPHGLAIQRIPMMPQNETGWGLRIWVHQRETAVALTAVYAADVFDAVGIMGFLADYRSVLRRVVDAPDSRIATFASCIPMRQRPGACTSPPAAEVNGASGKTHLV